MKTDISYSSILTYNTFPIPDLDDAQRQALTIHSRALILARRVNAGKTLAWLYDPDTMPADLLQAHKENDAYIEGVIYGRKYRDDTHRLSDLFERYVKLKKKRDPELGGQPALISDPNGESDD